MDQRIFHYRSFSAMCAVIVCPLVLVYVLEFQNKQELTPFGLTAVILALVGILTGLLMVFKPGGLKVTGRGLEWIPAGRLGSRKSFAWSELRGISSHGEGRYVLVLDSGKTKKFRLEGMDVGDPLVFENAVREYSGKELVREGGDPKTD